MPFMDEAPSVFESAGADTEEPDIDMPGMEPDEDEEVDDVPDDVGAAVATGVVGITATAAGTTARQRTPRVAQAGCREKRRAAGTGASAGSGTVGRIAKPKSTTSGPLAGSDPMPVISSPTPSPVTQ
jgi:hypothetical protein